MRAIDAKHYLLSASILWDRVKDRDAFPYSLATVRALDGLAFHPKVTFLVGENGSGKSTILEALAIAWGFNPEGGSKAFNFSTHRSHTNLHAALRLLKGPIRSKDGFFLRVESYYNVATSIDMNDSEPRPGRRIIDAYGGTSLHEQSHGESFFALLEHRFHGQGLYILDEPEAALSPSRQMSMLALMHRLIAKNAQFIIATHSPIIMSYPDATIFRLDGRGIEQVAYEDTEHVQVTREFLNHREMMLDILLKE